MKFILIPLMLMLPCSGVCQLVLPEFMAPEQDVDPDTSIVIEPGGQGHAPPDQEHSSSEKEKDEEIDDLINAMNRIGGTQVMLSPAQLEKLQKNQLEMKQPAQIYLSGPLHLQVKVTSVEGQVVQGKIENMTCRVKTPVGVLPVRLHEIMQAKRMEDGKGFSMELAGGDYLEGEFVEFVLRLILLDGGERELTGEQIGQLEFKNEAIR